MLQVEELGGRSGFGPSSLSRASSPWGDVPHSWQHHLSSASTANATSHQQRRGGWHRASHHLQLQQQQQQQQSPVQQQSLADAHQHAATAASASSAYAANGPSAQQGHDGVPLLLPDPNFHSPSSRPINDLDSDAGSVGTPCSPLAAALHPHHLHQHHAHHLGHSVSTSVLPSSRHMSLPPPPSARDAAPPAALPATAAGPLTPVSLGLPAAPPAQGAVVPYGGGGALVDPVAGGGAGALALRASVDGRPQAARFRQDVLLARTGSNAMDRYKALTRLLSSVKRDMATLGMEHPFKPSSWSGAAHLELLHRVVEVGEALSTFGTADFGERSNSSRAINTKDYAFLLRLYGESFWGLFKQEFIESMPQFIQDDMWTVRGLLTVRFEANSIIQERLMQNVGLEPQGGGQGAVVYNTSVVTANPVNALTSKPHNTVHACAAAAAKALHTSHTRLGAMAVGGLLGLWLVKRTGLLGFIPGMGRPRRRARSHSEDEEDDGGRGRGGRRGRGGDGNGGGRLTHEQRLLLAFDHVDRSYKELSKAQRNVELLRNDWRLGPVRLAAPFGGPDPPGFEALDLAACEPRSFMHAQLGYGRAP